MAGILAAAALLFSGCGGARHSAAPDATASADDSYGPLPSFLPKTAIQPDSVLTGTAQRPALTTEGDAVRVQLADASSVLVTVTGPDVPGEGFPYDTPSTTCTFTLAFSDATAPVPIDLADFSTLDHLGAIDHPAAIAGQPSPPKVIEPGQRTAFKLRMIMRTGEGLIRWAPGGAASAYASWDFEVETD